MADDTVRILEDRRGAEVPGALKKWVGAAAEPWRTTGNINEACSRILWKFWQRWVANFKNKKAQESRLEERDLMEGLEWMVCRVLLVEDVARRRIGNKREGNSMKEEESSKAIEWDRKIVFNAGDREPLARLFSHSKILPVLQSRESQLNTEDDDDERLPRITLCGGKSHPTPRKIPLGALSGLFRGELG